MDLIFLLPQVASKFYEDCGYLEFYIGIYLDFTDFIFKNAELYAGRQSRCMKFSVLLRSVCKCCKDSSTEVFTLGLSSITEGVFLLWSGLHFHSDQQLCSLADGKWKVSQLCVKFSNQSSIMFSGHFLSTLVEFHMAHFSTHQALKGPFCRFLGPFVYS